MAGKRVEICTVERVVLMKRRIFANRTFTVSPSVRNRTDLIIPRNSKEAKLLITTEGSHRFPKTYEFSKW